jgi:hypothetical protein
LTDWLAGWLFVHSMSSSLQADPSELHDLAAVQPNDLKAVLARLDYWESQSVEPYAVNGADRSCGDGKPQTGATAGAPAGSPAHWDVWC